ncbi:MULTISPECIES: UbiD family decarboxylase [Pseudomonas syringae group]|uniref:UbiD family decarboxylase n=1 Tax=Pseudomonas syringae group TaxID=136849 RepID=UPI000EFF48AC|nr:MULTISPECIES: UbiD family decarboxylase [Pseudomonas syringae group]MCF5745654.1 UbiD family decarboxylase [Pseudomonas tremae]RMP25041.1 UbiD family decarboxylase [Pseudomonas coronafaciens pv. atropurpurea]UQB35463.1 UbiD family decarboxylase [Pseudomonas tremae]
MNELIEPVADLRDWLARAEKIGELQTVSQAVDPIEEMSAITYLVARQTASPAVLFDQADSPLGLRHLWNIFGPSVARTAITLEEAPDTPTMELIRRTKDKLKQSIAPLEISAEAAPIYQNTLTGNDIDLTRLPIPKHWPRDGGAYAGTADAVFTRDLESGYLNVGTYRMMIQGPREVGLSLAPGKDALRHIHQAWARGEALPVAAAWGVDPLMMVVGSQSLPPGVSEYDFAGGIKGKPVEVVRAKNSDLLIPAAAEIVIEGVIRPGSTREEGPFGEFTGYYGYKDIDCPLIEVTALHYRTRPILTNALMADFPSNEQSAFFSTIRSAKIWSDLDKLGIQGIKGVYCPPAAAGAFGMIVISLEQKYAGHAAQALALASQVPGGAYISKWIVAVDEDVDPTDMNQVLWAMATRATPSDDIDILRNTRGSPLDPAQNPPEKRFFGSKALINACKDYRNIRNFPTRTLLRPSVYERVRERWNDLGLPGEAPVINAFDNAVDSHEQP